MEFKSKCFAPPTKNNPIGENEFIGQPPVGYSSWAEWVHHSIKTGFFSNVRIQAIKPA